MYLVFKNITIFLWRESLNHCITCTAPCTYSFPLCTQSRKNFFISISRTRHVNVPAYDWFRWPAGYFTGRIKMRLFILPVLRKFYRQNKQSEKHIFTSQTIPIQEPKIDNSGWLVHCAQKYLTSFKLKIFEQN